MSTVHRVKVFSLLRFRACQLVLEDVARSGCRISCALQLGIVQRVHGRSPAFCSATSSNPPLQAPPLFFPLPSFPSVLLSFYFRRRRFTPALNVFSSTSSLPVSSASNCLHTTRAGYVSNKLHRCSHTLSHLTGSVLPHVILKPNANWGRDGM